MKIDRLCPSLIFVGSSAGYCYRASLGRLVYSFIMLALGCTVPCSGVRAQFIVLHH